MAGYGLAFALMAVIQAGLVSAPAFPRSFVLVAPAYGEPPREVRDVAEGIRDYVRGWLR